MSRSAAGATGDLQVHIERPCCIINMRGRRIGRCVQRATGRVVKIPQVSKCSRSTICNTGSRTIECDGCRRQTRAGREAESWPWYRVYIDRLRTNRTAASVAGGNRKCNSIVAPAGKGMSGVLLRGYIRCTAAGVAKIPCPARNGTGSRWYGRAGAVETNRAAFAVQG